MIDYPETDRDGFWQVSCRFPAGFRKFLEVFMNKVNVLVQMKISETTRNLCGRFPEVSIGY
jgi:hypothetical protein